jgi:hypothetical protein
VLSLSRHLATGMGQRNYVDNVCEKGHPAKAYLSIELECEVQGGGKDSDDAPTDLVCFALREGYKVKDSDDVPTALVCLALRGINCALLCSCIHSAAPITMPRKPCNCNPLST